MMHSNKHWHHVKFKAWIYRLAYAIFVTGSHSLLRHGKLYSNHASALQPPHHATVGVTSVVIILPNICY